jgi:GT2 family glycosyltransferase
MTDLYGFEICIPYHGQYLNVRNCIESILLSTQGCPYRIFLIDDGSKNKDFFHEMKKLSNIVTGIQLKDHSGFGAALNAAVKNSQLPFLVFLHSDVKIVDGKWLIELYKSFCSLRKQQVEMVCATTNQPPNESKWLKKTRDEEQEDKVASEPLPIFSAMCARSLFQKVGLFKEYYPGGFEDEEFFYRLKRFGYKQGVSGLSWLEHFGGLTVKSLCQKDETMAEKMWVENRNKCLIDVKKLLGKSS